MKERSAAALKIFLFLVVMSISPITLAIQVRFAIPFHIVSLPQNFYPGFRFTWYENSDGQVHPFNNPPLLHSEDTYYPTLEMGNLQLAQTTRVILHGTLTAANVDPLLPAVDIDFRMHILVTLVNRDGGVLGRVVDAGTVRPPPNPLTRAGRTLITSSLTNRLFNPSTGASTDNSQIMLVFRPFREVSGILTTSLLEN